MKHPKSAPFTPDDPDLIMSVIRVISEEEHSDLHTDMDSINHESCCWAVAEAMETRRHRRVELLMKDMEQRTAWLVEPYIAITVAVFDPESPFGLLLRSRTVPEAPQFVWFRDQLFERNHHNGRLTFVCDAPMRFKVGEVD